LYPIARKYAEEWREYRMKLLEKGRSLEDLKRRGGDDELNLLILEEEEEDREFGRGGQPDYQYNVKEDKYIQELAQFLGICHCILVGLMADRYHFYHGDVRPKLPELLPGLLEKMPSNSLNEMLVGEIVSSYQSLYQSIEGKRPNAIPYLLLDLALSLSGLSDKSWAKKQVEFSIKAWLNLRNGVSEEKLGLLNLENLLEVFKSTLTGADIEYAEKLTGCLAAIGESLYQQIIGGVWEEVKLQEEAERQLQEEVERQRQEEAERQRQENNEYWRRRDAERYREEAERKEAERCQREEAKEREYRARSGGKLFRIYCPSCDCLNSVLGTETAFSCTSCSTNINVRSRENELI